MASGTLINAKKAEYSLKHFNQESTYLASAFTIPDKKKNTTMLWQYPFLLSLLPGSCTGRSANNPTATHTSNFQQMPDLPLSLSLHLHHWVVSFLDVIQSHFNLREQVNDLLLAAQELARIKTKHKVTSQHILAKPKASPSRDSRKMENLDTWKINVQITLVSSQLLLFFTL